MKKGIILLLCTAIVFALVGCGRTIKTNDGTTKVGKDKIQIKGNDGSTTTINTDDGNGASLPSDYPKDIVPIMDGLKIDAAQKTQQDNQTAFVVVCETTKDFDTVEKFYQAVAGNVTDKFESATDEEYLLGGKIKDYTISVGVMKSPSDDKTVGVTINVATGAQ